MDDEDKNDYDRIAERIEEITSVVWSASLVLTRDNDPAKDLCAPALGQITSELNQLKLWVSGLASTHRNMQKG